MQEEIAIVNKKIKILKVKEQAEIPPDPHNQQALLSFSARKLLKKDAETKV